MIEKTADNNERKMKSIFERYLTVWVCLCLLGSVNVPQDGLVHELKIKAHPLSEHA